MRSVQCLVALGAVLLLPAWRWPAPPPPAPSPLVLPRSLPQRVVDVPILEYHRVGIPAGLPTLTVSPGAFAAQIDWLHRNHFHAISERTLFEALEHGARLPRRPVLITFDDGYRDVLWNAAPLLHRLRMPAAAFVIVDRIGGGDTSFLDWRELQRLEGLGFTIGSHTIHHVALTSVSIAVAMRELVDSRRTLSRRLRRDVQTMAYPMGAIDDRVSELAKRAGYVLGLTERPGSLQSASQPLQLHRAEILSTTGMAAFAALVESSAR